MSCTVRLKNLISVLPKSNIPAGNCEKDGTIPFYTSSKTQNKYVYKALFPRDSIIMGTGGEASIHFSDVEYSTSTDCINFQVSSNTKYVYYNLLSRLDDINSLGFEGIGIRHLQKDYLLNIEIPNIDNKLQEKLVSFLDNKCTIIDSEIEKNKKSIELMEEYKISIMSSCLKEGLNKIPLKFSECNYLGKVPTNWDVIKLGNIFKIKKNIAGKEGYDILSITQTGIKVKDIESNEGQIAADYSKYQIVEVDDFAMNHMDLLTGYVDCSKYYGVTSPDYRVFNFVNKSLYNKNYYLLLLQLFYKEKIFYAFGQGVSNFGRWRLPRENFLDMLIPVPPIKEQKEIAEYLDNKCCLIDKVVKCRKSIIEKLEEYKKSIIYEVITGKIEV